MNTDIQPGERRVQQYGTVKVVECRCDAARIAVPLPRPAGSLCDLCGIKKPVWCAACGKWGDHSSGTCPTITH